jgi:hypothetical protein
LLWFVMAALPLVDELVWKRFVPRADVLASYAP